MVRMRSVLSFMPSSLRPCNGTANTPGLYALAGSAATTHAGGRIWSRVRLTGIRGGRNPSPADGGTPEHHGRAATTSRGERREGRLPLLRQPPEVPAIRQHVQREVGGLRARRDGARPGPPPAAGAPGVRRRHGRRHRAQRGHAEHAPALPDDAVLRRRQGNLGGGCAPLPGENARPVVRASGDGAGGHQHALLGGTVASAPLDAGGGHAELDRDPACGQHLPRVPRADRGASAHSG